MVHPTRVATSLLRMVATETSEVKEWFPYLVLLIVGVREVLLLITGMGTKRRLDGTSGGQSIEAWKLGGKQLMNDVLEDKLRPIRDDLDELLERRRRRR